MPSKLFHFEQVTSTNDMAKQLVSESRITETAVIVADEQTAGKGTQGRQWLSPKNAGLYVSVVKTAHSTEIPVTTLFTKAAGVACAEILQDVLGLTIQLKPINDLYVDGCKLGGILTESVMQEGRIQTLITGIGINLKQVSRQLPAGSVLPISLEEILPPHQWRCFNKTELLEALVPGVLHWQQAVMDGQYQRITDTFEHYALKVQTG